MKYLIMTEGTCEKALLDVMKEKGLLFYDVIELLYEDIHHARQINNRLIEMINQLPINEQITIIRIGDKLNDELKIPIDLIDRIHKILKICIKPEFEILHIIFYKKFTKYNSIKRKIKPSEYVLTFCKEYKKSYIYI